MNAVYELEAEHIIVFIFITVIYLILITLVGLSSKSNSLRLIGLGLLTAIVAVSYSGLLPLAAPTATGMMKIAFLLVFAGVLIPFFTMFDNTKRTPNLSANEGDSHE